MKNPSGRFFFHSVTVTLHAYQAGMTSNEAAKMKSLSFCTLHSIILHLIGGAPLLPKLRGYFAEFLRKVSLARLSLLDSPTCVGLRYGRNGEQPTAFLDTLSAHALRPKAKLDIRLSSGFSLCVPVGLTKSGDGILTICASITPYGLILAPG